MVILGTNGSSCLAGFILAFAVLLIALNWPMPTLRAWARKNQFKILYAKRCSTKREHLFGIRVRTEEGQDLSGLAHVGNFFGFGDVNVDWDD